MSNFQKVKKFMQTFGQEVKEIAEFPNDKILKLRYDLIEEELLELKVAIKDKNLIEAADALTDILYVTYGAGHALGINLDQCFTEVQNSECDPVLVEENREMGSASDHIYWKKDPIKDGSFFRT